MVDVELVSAIKNGDKSKIPELWNSVKGWSRTVAYRFYNKMKVYCDALCFDAEDLSQCGYFAMVNALKSYDISEDSCNFISWFTYYLTRQFQKELHIYSGDNNKNYKADFYASLKSLNDKVPIKDDKVELLELIADEKNDFAEIEEKDSQECLHKLLDEFMDDVLNDAEKTVIRKKYWDNKTEEQIALEENTTIKAVSQRINKGCSNLYKNVRSGYVCKNYRKEYIDYPSRRQLIKFIAEYDSFKHYSNSGLIRERTSVPEQLTILKESFGYL